MTMEANNYANLARGKTRTNGESRPPCDMGSMGGIETHFAQSIPCFQNKMNKKEKVFLGSRGALQIEGFLNEVDFETVSLETSWKAS